MAAECDTPVGAGTCGVLAVGRCSRCSNAFCTSHRGLVSGTTILDRCESCRMADAADGRAKFEERQRLAGLPQEYGRQLTAAGAKAVQVHLPKLTSRPRSFGRGPKQVWEYTPVGNAFPLGTMTLTKQAHGKADEQVQAVVAVLSGSFNHHPHDTYNSLLHNGMLLLHEPSQNPDGDPSRWLARLEYGLTIKDWESAAPLVADTLARLR